MTRIDNRLIQGQVGVTWTKTFGANLIVVADAAAASDTMAQELMSMTAESSGAGVRFFTTRLGYNLGAKAISTIKQQSETIGATASVLGVTVIVLLMCISMF